MFREKEIHQKDIKEAVTVEVMPVYTVYIFSIKVI